MDKRFFLKSHFFSRTAYIRHQVEFLALKGLSLVSNTMFDQNKQQNKLEEKGLNPNSFSVSEISLLRGNPSLTYIYKKTEKLVSAIYLLSGIISDKEPIKWQLREVSLGLVSKSLNSSDRSSFLVVILNILSYLEVAYFGGLISEMNFLVLKRELEGLIEASETQAKTASVGSVTFPEHFLTVPPVAISGSNDSKGQSILSDRYISPIERLTFNKQIKPSQSNSAVSNRSSSVGRQDIIISLLKGGKELGIKDFVLSIKDCSEKTIQRELATLVTKGQVKKIGEKRWSRYSLK